MQCALFVNLLLTKFLQIYDLIVLFIFSKCEYYLFPLLDVDTCGKLCGMSWKLWKNHIEVSVEKFVTLLITYFNIVFIDCLNGL